MDEAIPFSGKVSYELLCEAQRLHSRKLRRWLVIGAIAIIAFGTVHFAISWRDGQPSFSGILALMLGIWFLVFPVVQRLRTKRVYNKSPYLKSLLHGAVSRATFAVESDKGRSEIPWSDFIKVLANDDLVLLYRGPNLFNIMAATFFASNDDWQRARSLALDMIRPS
jgi:Na+/melibiose symporter-like transporter